MNGKRRDLCVRIAAGLATLAAAGSGWAQKGKALGKNPAPSPTPTPTPTPTVASHKGINGGSGLVRLTSTELADTVARYQALGVKWVRFGFDWSVIQPNNSTEYLFDRYDGVVRALAAAGIQMLGIIEYTPQWANGGKSSKFFPPVYASDFAVFAGALATRYGPMGVHAWEIWNEPNVGAFWGPAPDPAGYVTLLSGAYAAIRRADSSALVITGGLSQPGTTATTMRSIDFLTAIYKYGARGYFDAVGNHPYDDPKLPSQGYNWQQMYATSPSFLSVMAANGDTGKKIWVTEIGAPSNGAYTSGPVDETQQAAILTDAYNLARTYDWAGPVFWYNFKDFCAYDPKASTECFYGLVRYDGSNKPSATAFQVALD